jgi:hypothetical protein
MARACTVCIHREREAIDAALIRGEKNRRVAAHYNLVESSVRRHLPHIQRDLQAAQAVVESTHRRLRTLDTVVDECERDLEAVLAAHRETVADRDSGELVIKAVAQRAKLAALQFGTKRTTTLVDPRQEWEALSPAERRERLVEMKHRLLELEQETVGGQH